MIAAAIDCKSFLKIIQTACTRSKFSLFFQVKERRPRRDFRRGNHIDVQEMCALCFLIHRLEDLIMATNLNHIRELIDKLEALSPECIVEVEDFIDFLKQRDTGRQLTRMAKKAAEPSLEKVWDNPDDAVYDAL